MKPSIAAIIVSYNAFEPLRRCVLSLAESPLMNELVVVENGNDRKTSEFISALEGASGCAVVREGNLGWLEGVNRGVSFSSSPNLLLVNDDHVLSSGTVQRMMVELELGATLVGTEIAKIDPLHNLGTLAEGETWEYLSGSGCLIRRLDWECLGGYDSEFTFGYGEDIDFSCRVESEGGKLFYVPMGDSDYHLTDHRTVRKTDDFDLNVAVHSNHRIVRGRWWRRGRLDPQCRWSIPSRNDHGFSVAPRHFLLPQEGAGKGMALHGQQLLSALESEGAVLDDSSYQALSYVPCASFVRDLWYHREEWLFTMVEHDQMAVNQVEGIMDADVLVTPSRHSEEVFRKHGFEGPIHRVPLGIDTEVFNMGSRTLGWAGFMPFRFLWVGAPSQRKGWDLAIAAFYWLFGKERKEVELYIKTTGMKSIQGIEKIEENVIIDNRPLSSEELADLYRSSHALIFPSRGEGVGVPVLEAMACGCLVIAPTYTGLGEFIDDEVALVLEAEKIDAFSGTFPIVSDTPVPRSVLDQMATAYREYNKLLGRVRSGVKRAGTYTWKRTAEELMMKMGESVCV